MPIIGIDLVLFIAFVTWHYSLFCGYISDDHAAVENRNDIIPDEEKVDRGESFWVKRFNDGLVMFYHTRLFWKMGFQNIPFVWHLFSLGLHILNTYLLYLFLFPIMQEKAVYACLFWTINPMLNQNVVWISGRPYLFGFFFSMVALICHDNPLVFLPYYFIGLITNISIFFIPVINYCIHPDLWQSKLYLAFMFTGGAGFILWKFNKRFTKGLVIDRDNFRLKVRKLNTLAKMVLYYVYALFVPTKMGWYHQAGFRYNQAWEKFNYLTLIGYILLGYLLFYFKVSGWIFILGLLPNANIFATNSFLQDRYLYFCSIGVAMIVAPYLESYPALLYCLCTFYAVRAYMYSRHLKDDEKLYRENWRNHPLSDYAVNNLSYFLIHQRRYDESRVIIERGLHINRMNRMLWYNLGITWAAQGNLGSDEGKFRFIRALNAFNTALQIDPRWAKPAEDAKNIIKFLVDNKVLTSTPTPNSVEINMPPIIGLSEIAKGASSGTAGNVTQTS